MNAAVPYSVPKDSGALPAVLLAVAVHMALLAFLWFGVRWQNETPVAIEAEVWDVTPNEAAPPPPPEPEPVVVKETPKPVETPVVKPDIVLEQEKKRKEQALKQREQQEVQKKAEDEAKKKQELKDKALMEKTRQEARMRMLAQAEAEAGKGNSAKSQGPRGDPDYLARIIAKIRSRTNFPTPPDLTGNPTVEYALRLLPDGSVMNIRLLQSSGLQGFDEAVARGIHDADPFPADKSGVVPREIIVSYKLKQQ